MMTMRQIPGIMKVRQRSKSDKRTLKLPQHAVDGTRAAAAAHCDVKLVGMCIGHFLLWLEMAGSKL